MKKTRPGEANRLLTSRRYAGARCSPCVVWPSRSTSTRLAAIVAGLSLSQSAAANRSVAYPTRSAAR